MALPFDLLKQKTKEELASTHAGLENNQQVTTSFNVPEQKPKQEQNLPKIEEPKQEYKEEAEIAVLDAELEGEEEANEFNTRLSGLDNFLSDPNDRSKIKWKHDDLDGFVNNVGGYKNLSSPQQNTKLAEEENEALNKALETIGIRNAEEYRQFIKDELKAGKSITAVFKGVVNSFKDNGVSPEQTKEIVESLVKENAYTYNIVNPTHQKHFYSLLKKVKEGHQLNGQEQEQIHQAIKYWDENEELAKQIIGRGKSTQGQSTLNFSLAEWDNPINPYYNPGLHARHAPLLNRRVEDGLKKHFVNYRKNNITGQIEVFKGTNMDGDPVWVVPEPDFFDEISNELISLGGAIAGGIGGAVKGGTAGAAVGGPWGAAIGIVGGGAVGSAVGWSAGELIETPLLESLSPMGTEIDNEQARKYKRRFGLTEEAHLSLAADAVLGLGSLGLKILKPTANDKLKEVVTHLKNEGETDESLAKFLTEVDANFGAKKGDIKTTFNLTVIPVRVNASEASITAAKLLLHPKAIKLIDEGAKVYYPLVSKNIADTFHNHFLALRKELSKNSFSNENRDKLVENLIDLKTLSNHEVQLMEYFLYNFTKNMTAEAQKISNQIVAELQTKVGSDAIRQRIMQSDPNLMSYNPFHLKLALGKVSERQLPDKQQLIEHLNMYIRENGDDKLKYFNMLHNNFLVQQTKVNKKTLQEAIEGFFANRGELKDNMLSLFKSSISLETLGYDNSVWAALAKHLDKETIEKFELDIIDSLIQSKAKEVDKKYFLDYKALYEDLNKMDFYSEGAQNFAAKITAFDNLFSNLNAKTLYDSIDKAQNLAKSAGISTKIKVRLFYPVVNYMARNIQMKGPTVSQLQRAGGRVFELTINDPLYYKNPSVKAALDAPLNLPQKTKDLFNRLGLPMPTNYREGIIFGRLMQSIVNKENNTLVRLENDGTLTTYNSNAHPIKGNESNLLIIDDNRFVEQSIYQNAKGHTKGGMTRRLLGTYTYNNDGNKIYTKFDKKILDRQEPPQRDIIVDCFKEPDRHSLDLGGGNWR